MSALEVPMLGSAIGTTIFVPDRSTHYRPRSVSRQFLPVQHILLRQRGFQIFSSSLIPELAMIPPAALGEVPISAMRDGAGALLDGYATRHLRKVCEVSPFIGSAEVYSEVLSELEKKNPGTLRRLFLIDPDGYRGLSGYRWLVTSERVLLPDPRSEDLAEHAVTIASYNGRDFTTGLRKISNESGEVAVLPLVAPRRALPRS